MLMKQMRVLLSVLVLGITVYVASPLASAQSPVAYTGVNLAGADFGESALPGTYGSDYTYPIRSEVDYFVGKGMNTFRLPFRWERLQRSLNANFDASELARIDDFVSYATSKGAYVVLDPHNYARYGGQLIGQGVPIDAFKDFWSKLAAHYRGNARVIFGLMNEPKEMPTELWHDDANAAIQAIRAAGATNLILVPGNGWTGAHSWNQSWYGTSNATVMLGITDPGNNYAFEVHQYFDGDYSGTSEQCVSATIGSEKLVEFTNWLRQNNKRGFLGEFAGGRNATCYQALDNTLDYIDSNADVWLGWTYWAAGPWWGEYMFSIEPTNCPGNCIDRPQMAYLAPHFANSQPPPTPTPSPTPVPTPITGTGTGLRGEYYDNTNFTALKTTRTDANVNFNWGTTTPAGTALTSPDTFSVRWTGKIEPRYSETYTFTTTSDDGVRLWVNGAQIINNWTNHSTTDNQGTIALNANQRYDIRMEYYENAGGAVARLAWASQSQAKQIIPTKQLYPAVGSTPAPTPTPTPPASNGALKVQYRAGDTNATDNQLKPHFRIANTGATSVSLSELKLRYWFIGDGSQAINHFCDWAQVGCGNLTASVVTLTTPVNGADRYLEIGFTSGAGSLLAGTTSGEIQSRMAKVDWSNFNEANDYSFDATKTTFMDWPRVTLYRNGVLIWGSGP